MLEKIYEDETLLVYNKPAFLNCDDFPLRIHRLDKEASGVFLVAKDKKAQEFYQSQFKQRKVEKKYWILVYGNLKNKKGEIKSYLGRSPKDRRKQKVFSFLEPHSGKLRWAETYYRVLKKFENYDFIEVIIKTGRKHQIRVHFAYLGHPVVGDKLYAFKNQKSNLLLDRLFLHCFYLKIKLLNGREKEFYSPLPEELENFLKKLKEKND